MHPCSETYNMFCMLCAVCFRQHPRRGRNQGTAREPSLSHMPPHQSWAELAAEDSNSSWADMAAEEALAEHGPAPLDLLQAAPAVNPVSAALPVSRLASQIVETSEQTTTPAAYQDAGPVGPFQSMVQSLTPAGTLPEVDPEVAKLASHYLATSMPQMQLSKVAVAKFTGVSSDNIENKISLLACTLLEADKMNHIALEMALAESDAKLLCCCELVRYDETPMKVAHKQQLQDLFPATGPTGASSPSTSTLPSHGTAAESVYAKTLRSTPTASKIFAVEQRFLMVLQLGSEAAAGDPPLKYVALSGQDLTSLRVMHRASGECEHQCLKESSPISRWANVYTLKVRVATTDQAGSNFAAKEAFQAVRQPDGWSSLHLPCQLRIMANVFSKTFDLANTQITGMVNLSLYLGLGGQMHAFRKALTQVVQERMVIIRGTCPPEARAYRSCMLDIFCSKGRNLAIKRFLLEHFATGDWRKRDAFEVSLPPAIEVDETAMQANVCQAMAIALTGSLFRIYPRHRWVGADITLDQIGLCEAVHGLASAAFGKMQDLSAEGGRGRASVAAGSQAGAMTAEQGQIPGTQMEPEAVPGVAFAAAQQPLDEEPGAGQAEAHARLAEEVDPQFAFSAANAAAHRKACEWLNSSPVPKLVAMRLSMKPLTDLLEAHLHRASDAWETQQRAAAAVSESGEAPCGRKCRLLEYLQLVSEQHFFEELAHLRTSPPWGHIDQHQWHLDFQGWIFRTLSRMWALVHELMVLPTKRYPMQLFTLLLQGGDRVRQLLDSETCVRDGFTSTFMQTFAGEEVGF